MGLIVLDGLLMLVLVLAGLREAIMDAIPRDLRLADWGRYRVVHRIQSGWSNAGFVVMNIPEAPLRPGTLHDPNTAIAFGRDSSSPLA